MSPGDSTGTLRLEITPYLVHRLIWAARHAGAIDAMRFTFYRRRQLAAQALHRRIALSTGLGTERRVLEDVAHVVAGDLLPADARGRMLRIRRFALLHEAARERGRQYAATTASDFALYLDLAHGQPETTLWIRFVDRHRRPFSDALPSPPPTAEVEPIYAWLAAHELAGGEPLLRAAVLNWGLRRHYDALRDRPAINAVIEHELRARGYDPHDILVLDDLPEAREARRIAPFVALEADRDGDLTRVAEHFVTHMGDALASHRRALERQQSVEDRQPWMMVRPPDELDRFIFDAIERLARARSREILHRLPEPKPPLRTLQRRLQQLTLDGLIAKHGSRKAAYYVVAERS